MNRHMVFESVVKDALASTARAWSLAVVVTPFRRQAALIRNMLQAQLPQGSPLPMVDTVERVQGLTVELVVVSLCVSDREYARARAAFLFSSSRLNVALSRARTTAILVAAPAVLAVAALDPKVRDALDIWCRLVARASRVINLPTSEPTELHEENV